MRALNTPVPLFKVPGVDKQGFFVGQVQNWFLNLYDRNKDSTFWLDQSLPMYTAGYATPMTWDTANVGLSTSASSTTGFVSIWNLPNSWLQGSAVYPMIRWEPTTANAGNVLWGAEYKWTNQGETEAASWTPLAVITAAAGSLKHTLSQFPAIDGTGKTMSSILTVRVFRVGGDARDTYPDAALVKDFSITYENDTYGSRTALSK